jgi:eukaryotic-like serine/threonine-protein kinase
MPDLATGTMIDGRYKVISRLGAGGMADVFCAEDQQLGRKVALKLLHRRFAEDPGFVERFRREAQAAAGLQHPNVVSVYDRGAFDGTYYIAMEYLPGRSLKQLIRQEAPLDPVRAIDITIQILKAARFAHRRGVIHRDLKPHNVIVDDSDHAKVTDFGIARAGASDMTETGSIMGTAQYLSPEQAQGHAVSAQSDLYAVGVVLYEMLTGRVPFDGDQAVTIALKHVAEAPIPPRQLNPNIPPDLEQATLWALNKNAQDRPADAEQFIEVLQQIREQLVSGTRGQRTATFAAVGALAPDGDGARAVSDTSPPTPAPVFYSETEELPPRERQWWPWLVALLLLLLLGGGAAAYLLTRPTKKIVPAVVGDNVNDATTILQNAGFNPTILQFPSPKKAGTVIGQDPLGGQKVNEGSTVQLKVSTGPGSTVIPSVVGLSATSAKQRIKQAGLKLGQVQSEASDTIAAGHATRTDPTSGSSEPVGTAITLFISSGKAKVAVPNVVGETESQAKSTLTGLGFQVTSNTQQSTTDKPGTVISQSPAANTQLTKGAGVTITVAQAPPPATVPKVKGDTVAQARSALTAAGFQVVEQSKNVHRQVNDGIVLSQSPGAGSKAKKGSTVTVVVGHFNAPPPPTTTTTPSTTTTPTTTTTST